MKWCSVIVLKFMYANQGFQRNEESFRRKFRISFVEKLCEYFHFFAMQVNANFCKKKTVKFCNFAIEAIFCFYLHEIPPRFRYLSRKFSFAGTHGNLGKFLMKRLQRKVEKSSKSFLCACPRSLENHFHQTFTTLQSNLSITYIYIHV